MKKKQQLNGTLETRLQKTRSGLIGRIRSVFSGVGHVGEAQLKALEEQLLLADLGLPVTQKVIDALADEVDRKTLQDAGQALAAIQKLLQDMLAPACQRLEIPKQTDPFIILVVGVNGSGKTTTIAKLAKQFSDQGRSVLLAAGDTFRAAATEQLKTWGQRLGIKVVAQSEGADSASVIFDAIESAKASGVEIVLADTAGRLHTQNNLMKELEKVRRVAGKALPGAPHEVLLVLDANTGQNALSQAKQFHAATGVTGIALTKLDGTAKGGMIFSIYDALGLPIRYIGVGEQAEDLRQVQAAEFVGALFDGSNQQTAVQASVARSGRSSSHRAFIVAFSIVFIGLIAHFSNQFWAG